MKKFNVTGTTALVSSATLSRTTGAVYVEFRTCRIKEDGTPSVYCDDSALTYVTLYASHHTDGDCIYKLTTVPAGSVGEARAALKVHEAIERRITRERARFGYTFGYSFNEWFVLVCEALEIEQVGVLDKWDIFSWCKPVDAVRKLNAVVQYKQDAVKMLTA